MTAERSGASAIRASLTSLDLSSIHNETKLATMGEKTELVASR
jgi:hypothetical protein